MKLLNEQKALANLQKLKSDFKSEISNKYEQRAKSCVTCETPGACCLDAHFVNVQVSRLEAKAIHNVLDKLPGEMRKRIHRRVKNTIEKYNLSADGDTFTQTYACPLFEKGAGCLVHSEGKPLPCIVHACYENASDLPPAELLDEQEHRVDKLNTRAYGRAQPWLPLPLALMRLRKRGPRPSSSK